MIVLCGGGTGGHLSVIKSLKEELNKRGIKPIFIGSSNGQDKKWFENDKGFSQKYFFDTKGVVNKNKIGKMLSLLNIFKYTLQCFFIFKKYHISKIISVGGYSAAPASFGAILFKKELYIHEQNAKMGTLNRKLSPFAKAIFSSYIENSPIKEYPVDKNFFLNARIKKDIKTIIFLGGSQGANFINNLAKKLAPSLKEKNIHIIHQCGVKSFDKLKEFYSKNNLEIELYGFINDMPSVLKKADFAISRSGASTLWELCATYTPSLFIPYPYAASDHQYFNAKFLKDRKLCYILRENKANKNTILNIINKTDVHQMSKLLATIIKPDGAKKIIDYILS